MAEIYGLSENEVFIAREKFGTNEIKGQTRKTFIGRFIENLFDPIIKILIFALIINIVFMLGNFDIIESIGIAATIIISTLVSTISEIGSEKAFDKLDKEFGNVDVKVYRDGYLKTVKSKELVIGDFVLINSGDKIPADGIIVKGEIGVDQSALTGETMEVKKFHGCGSIASLSNPSALFCGSLATSGSCVMKITAISDKTFYGSAAKNLTEETPTSPLKEKLKRLAKTISYIGYFGASLVAFIYFFNDLVVKNGFDPELIILQLKNVKYMLSLLIKCLTTAITIVVVAVPEGLPMMITVVLSSNMKKMLKDNILIKKLVGIETAGSMNLLFCDKTGTITTGKQSLNSFIMGNGEEISFNNLKRKSRLLFDELRLNAQYNTECVATAKGIAGGNPTDRAISRAFIQYNSTDSYLVSSKIHFDSSIKYSAVKIKGKDTQIYYKGAPDKLLNFCLNYIDDKGEVHPLNKDALRTKIDEIEKRSQRLCLIAKSSIMCDYNFIPELTLIAIAVISDPLRSKAKGAVKEIQRAGVQIIMITGDSPNTAISIAKSINLYNDKQNIVLTGEQLSKTSDVDVKKMLPKIAVISRALPGDKRRLVELAQEIGLVTGMTGDGINDSPALKLADIGFAMGSGTEVAKEAGDVVILNNDLKSIGKCMLYGRTIFESIRKFIVFQLTMNFCAVSVTILGPLLGIETPITMIQMLWINIIMDTIGALAFACEAPLPDTMEQKPKKRNISIVSPLMISKILINGLFSLLLCVIFMKTNFFLKYFEFQNNQVNFLSGLFCLFVFAGIVNAFTSRSVRLNIFSGLKDNRFFILIMACVAVVQLMMLYFGNSIFRTTPLDVNELLILIAMSLIIIPADFIRKLITKKVNKHYI